MYYRYDSSRNCEGYRDMTACRALRNIDRDERKERRMKRDYRMTTKKQTNNRFRGETVKNADC